MTVEQLKSKWGHIVHANRIPTWTEDYNLAFCCEEASKAQFGVELGTYMGASAKMMLLANPKLHLWCVDKFSLVFGLETVANLFLQDEIVAGRCELINGDSEKGGQMLSHMQGKLDFVFVDDGHATEDVLRDIRWFYPLLKPGGVMFGHDFEVGNNGEYNDVAQGVIRSGIKFDVPVPRMWRSFK
jgi:predicted O-methyltransferase YrrM